MIDARERAIFERIKTVLTEIGTLQDDLAELKLEAEKAAGLTKERIGDLVAVARRQVMDAAALRRSGCGLHIGRGSRRDAGRLADTDARRDRRMKPRNRRADLIAALAERRADARRKARIAKGGERNKAQARLVAATAALLKAEVSK